MKPTPYLPGVHPMWQSISALRPLLIYPGNACLQLINSVSLMDVGLVQYNVVYPWIRRWRQRCIGGVRVVAREGDGARPVSMRRAPPAALLRLLLLLLPVKALVNAGFISKWKLLRFAAYLALSLVYRFMLLRQELLSGLNGFTSSGCNRCVQ
ncbi:hypothetical protein EVAR_62338_1 [Eumeta japonica]|uniref:Uncharacterized protein n=1 Tax=Eumeta variegata TaxID=151549 RepID=A0A4C1ZPI9_EUMVA|nr:hypothetical protein EVAR_62338_1 [Eumeta japonica]